MHLPPGLLYTCLVAVFADQKILTALWERRESCARNGAILSKGKDLRELCGTMHEAPLSTGNDESGQVKYKYPLDA